MSTTDRFDALRTALVAAGRHLAASHIHGRFHIARRSGAMLVTFSSEHGSATRITDRALLEATEALQGAGFEASRCRFEVVVDMSVQLAA